MEALNIRVFKDSFGPITELLQKNDISWSMREQRSGVVMASSGVIQVLTTPELWGALAAVLIAFIKYKNGRSVKITTKDNAVIEAKGLTAAELERILPEAKDVAAIDMGKE